VERDVQFPAVNLHSEVGALSAKCESLSLEGSSNEGNGVVASATSLPSLPLEATDALVSTPEQYADCLLGGNGLLLVQLLSLLPKVRQLCGGVFYDVMAYSITGLTPPL
jgi:hypothetical protein